MNDLDRVTVGLALGSGAFRGLAHIGVLEVFQENGIPIDYIAGSSIGAVVGAVYACGVDMGMVGRLVTTINERDYFDTTIPRMGFMKGTRAQELLLTLTGNRDFSQTLIPFAATAVDLEKGELVTIREGKLHEAMRASMSVPGVFEPMRLNGRMLVDGGVLCRVPIGPVREMGADVVVAVDVGARSQEVEVHNLVELMLRTLELMEWNTVQRTLGSADVVLLPDVYRMQPWSLSTAKECMEIGREIAYEKLDDVREAMERARERKKIAVGE